MKLDEVFGQGHRVAYVAGTPQHAVRCPHMGSSDDGEWLVAGDALPRIAYRKEVDAEDLAGKLGEGERANTEWFPDETHCWCEQCHTTRKLLETQDE